jgi:hypothetical protein
MMQWRWPGQKGRCAAAATILRGMRTPSCSLLVFLAATSALCAQVRAKKDAPADFPAVLQQAGAAYEAKEFGAAIEKLKAALVLAAAQLRKQIAAAMPAAPPGFTAVPPPEDADLTPDNAMAGALIATVGNMVDCEYQREDGNGSIRVSVAAHSPMAPMLAMAFAAASANPNTEVVTYGDHKGTLETQQKGEQYQLQILIASKHLVTVAASGIGDEPLLKTFDQAFVDRIAKLLGK